MAPATLHLPNGHQVIVTPVFGGLSFKASELTGTHSVFPPGWTVVLHAEEGEQDKRTHRFREPSLRNDHLFISSISIPSSHDFKTPVSQTRQIAMMLWATLWWYFHQPEPNVRVSDDFSSKTPEAGRPKHEWRININREGIMKGKYLLPKLERMGLVTVDDPSVGLDNDDRTAESWSRVYTTRRHFWQLDARIFLFSLSPTIHSPYPPGSPVSSRPSSPNRAGLLKEGPAGATAAGAHQGTWSTTDPFRSTSFLPTFFPPAPSSYIWTNGVRHPQRPKAPRQGEVFYTRFVPSLGETLSFRTASMPRKSLLTKPSPLQPSRPLSPQSASNAAVGGGVSDVELLHKWMNNDRVAAAWGEDGPVERQQQFLETGLQNRHSFPVIGMFNGKPFGFFEIYWVKEDPLGPHLGGSVGSWDRGFHCLVGEQEFRGSHRVKVWLSSLVHYCFVADMRTEAVLLEPRVDNDKLRRYCEDVGFYKEREVTFPHKQSNVMRITREGWEAPCL